MAAGLKVVELTVDFPKTSYYLQLVELEVPYIPYLFGSLGSIVDFGSVDYNKQLIVTFDVDSSNFGPYYLQYYFFSIIVYGMVYRPSS